MRAQMRKYLLAAALLLAVIPLSAQFYLPGDDPARLRWYSLESAHYEVIYPEGADSLARDYARALEQFRIPMGRSLGGMTPGAGQRRKFPVVLHTHNVYSNGSVGWAPSRMDLYTHPEAYSTDPIPWHRQLAAHEPRHQSQLQFGQRGIIPWFVGQMWAPVYWQLYIEQSLAEGDAVVAETGLSHGTRARTADFLNYYQVALSAGNNRSWDRWRYGSFKHYTPDHYALGYLTLAGARTLYDDPLILREAIDLAWKKPWFFAPYNTQKIIVNHARKPFKEAFQDIQAQFDNIWEEQRAARGPFMPMEALTKDESYALEFESPEWTEEGIIAIRKSYQRPGELVLIKDGKIKVLHAFAGNTSQLFPDNGCIYWSETRPHPRWGLDGSSVICCYNLLTRKLDQITRDTRYYNPHPSPEGERLAVMEYPVEGGSALVVLQINGGSVLRRVPLPEGVQGTEAVWRGEDLYAAGISRDGAGLYRLQGENWIPVLPPSEQKMVHLEADGNCLEWVSDRSGVNELYRYNPASGSLQQITSTPFGASDFTSDGAYLYYVAQAQEGRPIYRTPLSALQPRDVQWADVAARPIEEELTAQEAALGPLPDLDAAVPLSAPKRYRKLAHPLRLHSWAPLYVNYDAIKSGSADFSFETAAPGLSGYFQNNLGTFSGMIGLAVHPDPDRDGVWRGSLHLKAVYSGLYPIFEASLDIGNSQSRRYVMQDVSDGSATGYRVISILQNTPEIAGSLRAYVPLSFSHSGTLFGVTPQLNYSFSNNAFADDTERFLTNGTIDGLPALYARAQQDASASGPAQNLLSATVRGYVMARRGRSQVYPRWGLGLETGIGFRPGLTQFYAPNAFAYAYGYLPGFTRSQGLRLTFTGQQKLGKCLIGDLYAGVAPRGFTASSGVSALIGQNFSWQWRATADYAIPIYVGDISIPALAYIRNFLLVPHADYTGLPYSYNLWSVGADLSASLSRLLFLPFDASIGVSFNYLGGTLYPYTRQTKPYSFSLIFGVDF